MKRVLLACALCVAVLVAVCLGVAGTAYADQAVAVRNVTADYYDLGTIHAIDAHADSVAVLRAKDGVPYLTVMGGVQADVSLAAYGVAVDDLADMRLAYYDGRALLSLGHACLSVYDCRSGELLETNIQAPLVSSDEWGEQIITPLNYFAVDENGWVYVCYATTLRWYKSFDDIFSITKPDIYSTPMVHSPQSFAAHDHVCYFYTNDGFVHRTDVETSVSISESIGAMTDYDYADADMFLRDGALYCKGTEAASVLVNTAAEERWGDQYLQNATAFCTSRDGAEWRVWVVDNGQSAVKTYGADGTYLGMYGTYGADDGRLRSPTQVAHDVMTVVNDSGNHRTVVLRNGVYTHIDGDAASVTTAGERVYVAVGREVDCYDFSRGSGEEPYTVTQYYAATNNVVSVAVDGTIVYALTTEELYMFPAVTPIYRGHANRIKSGRHAGIVYVETDAAIVEYKDGEAVGVSIDVSTIDVIDFAVDYCGNVYVLTTDGAIYRYDRLVDGYTAPTALTTARAVQALDVHRDGAVYALAAHALVTLDLDVSTRASSAYPEPTWDDPVSVVKITETVWGYACPNNYESMVKVPAGTYAMLMAPHTYLGTDYYYVEFALDAGGVVRNERAYVPRTSATAVAYDQPLNTYVRFDGATAATGVYPYPSYSAEALYMVPKAEAVFQVLRVMGVEEGRTVWPWYMVRYKDRVCYVAADNYVDAEPPYVEVERYYARCVANKLGEKVTVYAAPDPDAEVVTTLVDGTKIELVAPYDADSEYTCIRIDDREVYIRTANVTTRSLTNGQTFALIMSLVVICAAAVTLVLYLLVKKGR